MTRPVSFQKLCLHKKTTNAKSSSLYLSTLLFIYIKPVEVVTEITKMIITACFCLPYKNLKKSILVSSRYIPNQMTDSTKVLNSERNYFQKAQLTWLRQKGFIKTGPASAYWRVENRASIESGNEIADCCPVDSRLRWPSATVPSAALLLRRLAARAATPLESDLEPPTPPCAADGVSYSGNECCFNLLLGLERPPEVVVGVKGNRLS
jgi:hypothetical protein